LEPATGITFFLDSLIHAVPRPPAENNLFLPRGTPKAKAEELRYDGWITVMELGETGEQPAEARRTGCTHILTDEGIREIDSMGGD
jgi:ATP phosphoribosyltransferase regulatory subunit